MTASTRNERSNQPMPHRLCPDCKRALPAGEFYAGSSQKCKGCTTWSNLKYNAKKEGHALTLTKSEFQTFYKRASERWCSYCGISEASFTTLRRKSPRGHIVQCLGIDRSDSAHGYTAQNVRLACFVCNRIKSDIFSASEMERVGRAIGQAWRGRGLDSKQAELGAAELSR